MEAGAGNLCGVPGVRVGHASDPDGGTGCTVVTFDRPVVGGAEIARGSATGTREAALLDPINQTEEVHGILLTGGSAFGLAAADGVMRYLEEQGRGLIVRDALIPIVPAAVIFDLGFADPNSRPTPKMGYAAAENADAGVSAGQSLDQGNVGAGTGATVGKLLGPERAMKGGLGSVAVWLPGGLVVGALAVVNALGSIRDPQTGATLAAPRNEDGGFADSLQVLTAAYAAANAEDDAPSGVGNTTLGVVATNARLSKAQAGKVAQMAQSGLVRAVYPSHTPFDGDTVFAVGTGEVEAPAALVGAWAAQVMQEAILRGVRSAEPAGGLPGLAER